MVTDPVEVAVQRAITDDFIARDYVELVLTPRAQTRTATGGFVWAEGTPRDPQQFHVIERVTNAQPRTRVPGGEQREEDFTLLGRWDAEVAAHDVFELDGGQWEVISVAFPNGYEQRATVIRFGR